MKKFILTVVALVGFNNFLAAQDYQQTVNWLKDNIGQIDHVNCPTIQLYGNNLEINDSGVKLYDENQSCKIEWSEIKDVEKSREFIYLISEKTIDNKPIVLKFFINNEDTDIYFTHALKFMKNLNDSNIAKNK
jgi:hypothetical protein